MKRSNVRKLDHSGESPLPQPGAAFLGQVVALTPGELWVEAPGGVRLSCQVLDGLLAPLQPGDQVMVMRVDDPGVGGVVMGRVRAHDALPSTVQIEASTALSLRCGETAIELRGDGRALIKGDDVVVRAKGTQRIRAGHVAIN